MYRLPATFICILLIIYLFWMDRKKNEGVSSAIWIPFIWMVFAGSREFSFWLHYWFNIGFYSESIIEGNPVERVFHSILIAAGVIVLIRRRLNWGEIMKKNSFIMLYILFGLISILWSDFPLVSLKRWIKTWGSIIMALIILSEERPYVALGFTLRRIAFLFLPLSILFIKYYPALGRAYHSFSGRQFLTGVAGGKNGLGAICLFSGIYFLWALLLNRWGDEKSGQRLNSLIYIVIIPMIVWLFYKADSATALTCMIVTVFLFIVARQRAVARKPRRIMAICLGSIIFFGIMELFFDFKNTVITALGRRPDLTTRVPMWADLLTMVKNPLIGSGFESFWLGDRLISLQARWGDIIQAHNGYLETYLNVGAIGLFLLLSWIISGLKKVSRSLTIEYKTATLSLCIIIILSLYNLTEASFYGIGVMWIMFLFATVDLSRYRRVNTLDRENSVDNS